MPTALITCLHLQRHFDRFRPEYDALGVAAVLPRIDGQQLDAPTMASLIEDADAVVAGDDVIDQSVLRAGKASRLKVIVKWGVGTDAIDTATASALGVPVFNTPGVFANEVADLAMSHLLLLVRKTHQMHASVVDGDWLKVEGRSLFGLTAGIIGLGSVGTAIAKRAAAFGMNVVGNDIRPLGPPQAAPEIRHVDLDTLYRESDVVFVACDLTREKKHLISQSAFAQMRKGVLIVNVARGALVDQAALVDALASGTVAGAGLDVFEAEPLPPGDPLRAFADRCVFTTHNASNTTEAVERTNRMATDILFDALGLKKIEGFVPNRVA